MSNRITSTDKWRDRWFSELSIYAKLLFIYLCENCDNAGIYEVNRNVMLAHLGVDLKQLKDAIQEINKAYIKSNDGSRVWLKNYLRYQKKLPLNENNNNHKQIIAILEENLFDDDKFKGCASMERIMPSYVFKKAMAIQKANENKGTSIFEPEEAPKNHLFAGVEPVYQKAFVKPKLNEVREYMKSEGFGLYATESVKFFNFYNSKGWMVGINPMNDWQSSVVNWIIKCNERALEEKTVKASKIDNIKQAHENMSTVDWNERYK